VPSCDVQQVGHWPDALDIDADARASGDSARHQSSRVRQVEGDRPGFPIRGDDGWLTVLARREPPLGRRHGTVQGERLPEEQMRGCEIPTILGEDEPPASRTLFIRQQVTLRPQRGFIE
jgi:hypothetical protein